MIPIKLLADNNELLRFVEEDHPALDTDDFLERAVMQGSEDAKTLLAIENATEIAKRFIQEYYEDILRAIRSESVKKEKCIFRCKNLENLTPTDTDVEYIHLEANLDNDDGHAIYIKVNNVTKQIQIYDSMGEGAYVHEFEDTIRERYPGYRIRDKSLGFQPTGGFTQETPEQMSTAMYISGEPGYLNRAWEVSQYDELSQHHFCYIESFVAMAFDNISMHRSGPEDPRERLRYIKRVVWGFVHKFYKGSREGPVWEYFTKHFPVYMTTRNCDGSIMQLKNDIFQVPKKETFIKRVERFETIDTSAWTIKAILKWADAC
tara:strand:- start:6231 stop:7187 length:957 start_codon:yes stop_codon:yes gene_type:complete